MKGSRHAMADAVSNVVENALQHTPAGTAVTVSVEADASVVVCDRGAGIPPEDRERIFERFWRRSDTRGTGAGLGLAIVRETLRAHGGSIEVGANPNGGARFTLRFRPP